MLGHVDGFDEDEGECESNDGSVVLCCLLATERHALETLELAHSLLDAGASPVERLGEEPRPVPGRRLERDHRTDMPLARGRPVPFGVIAFVAHCSARRDIGPDVEQNLELASVAGLALREVKGKRMAVEVHLEVDLGREAATRAAQSLSVLPPLAPAAKTCARTIVESNIWTRCAVRLRLASASKKASNTPARLSR